MEQATTKVPAWYWVVSIIFLLWNIMGVLSFFAHSFIPAEAMAALPENERALYAEYPMWIYIVFALAVLFGLLGAVGLLIKKKWAKMAAIISFVAIIIQMTHNVFFTSSIEVYGTAQAVTMPIIVVVLGLLLILFTKNAVKKEWLK